MSRARRAFIGLLAAAALLVVGVGPAQAETVRFEATFDESACEIPFPAVCGTGVVAQFGSATLGGFPDFPACIALSLRSEVIITVAGGTLTACQIGSAFASDGRRGVLSGPFTVTGGTGVFAGASGGGNHTCEIISLGSTSIIRCQYSGTLTLY